VNRVYAIRYARRDAGSAEHFYGHDPHDAPMPMDYFLWVAIGDAGAVVVDAGFTPETARERGREIVCDPVDVLARLGVAAADVRDVVLTHLHYDHTGNLSAFPRARFWVQDAELGFWTGRHAGRGELGAIVTPGDVVELVRLNFAGRVAFVDGDGEVAPGITVHHVGGHAPGLQVVLADTAAGPVLLASDASHFYANLEQDRPYAIVHSLPGMYAAFDRVRALAARGPRPALVVPGHDPLVMARHPAAPGLEGLAVELRPAPAPALGPAPDLGATASPAGAGGAL
jgi:glyoxylase-like metal-dependent hydrolase (beta-lactamase superfamily II)